MGNEKSEVLQGTLDLMILKTLHALGPQHGFGIARRIEQVSEDVLTLNEGTVYTSLLRLQQRDWITAEWGVSELGRRARFYSLTVQGRKQLELETETWSRLCEAIEVPRIGAHPPEMFQLPSLSWLFSILATHFCRLWRTRELACAEPIVPSSSANNFEVRNVSI